MNRGGRRWTEEAGGGQRGQEVEVLAPECGRCQGRGAGGAKEVGGNNQESIRSHALQGPGVGGGSWSTRVVLQGVF